MGIHYGKADFITYGKPSLVLDFANKKSLTDRISGNNLLTFTRTSTGTYVGADGLIKSVTTNEPRFDHNPTTLESLGLLIEEQRTNLLTYSENFSSWSIQTGASITANQGIAPDGTLTASFLTGTGMVNNGVFSVPSASVSTTSNSTKSIYLRSVSGTPSVLLKDPYLTINTQVVNLTTEWQRFSLTEIQSSGLAGIWIDSIPTEGIYAWGAQVEEGSFPTSYIPTSGSQVTRNADSASITGSNLTSFYNQTQGTLLNRFRNFGYGNAYHAGTGVSFDNSQFQRNMISLNMRRDGPFYRNGALVIFNDTTFTDALTTAGNANNINDIVNYYNFIGSFSSSRRAFTYNGLTTGVNTGTIVMPTISRFLISTNSNYVYDAFCGHIAKISYYPVTLTDAQLQSITR